MRFYLSQRRKARKGYSVFSLNLCASARDNPNQRLGRVVVPSHVFLAEAQGTQSFLMCLTVETPGQNALRALRLGESSSPRHLALPEPVGSMGEGIKVPGSTCPLPA